MRRRSVMCVHVEAVQTHLPTELVAPLPELLHARASRCALSFSLLLIHQRKLVPPKKRAPRLVNSTERPGNRHTLQALGCNTPLCGRALDKSASQLLCFFLAQPWTTPLPSDPTAWCVTVAGRGARSQRAKATDRKGKTRRPGSAPREPRTTILC